MKSDGHRDKRNAQLQRSVFRLTTVLKFHSGQARRAGSCFAAHRAESRGNCGSRLSISLGLAEQHRRQQKPSAAEVQVPASA